MPRLALSLPAYAGTAQGRRAPFLQPESLCPAAKQTLTAVGSWAAWAPWPEPWKVVAPLAFDATSRPGGLASACALPVCVGQIHGEARDPGWMQLSRRSTRRRLRPASRVLLAKGRLMGPTDRRTYLQALGGARRSSNSPSTVCRRVQLIRPRHVSAETSLTCPWSQTLNVQRRQRDRTAYSASGSKYPDRSCGARTLALPRIHSLFSPLGRLDTVLGARIEARRTQRPVLRHDPAP